MKTNDLIKIIYKYFPKAKLITKSEHHTYTEIIHFKIGKLNLIAKLIAHDILSKYPTKERQKKIEELQFFTNQYYQKLKEIGIKVPTFYKTAIKNQKLVEFATDLGKNRLDKILESTPLKKMPKILSVYIKSILPAITQKEKTVGLDANAENLFLSKNKDFVYCDFVPTRIKNKSDYLVGFPQPNNKKDIIKSFKRYYLPYGILRRSRFFILKINPELDDIFFKILENHLGPIQFKKIKSQFTKNCESKIKKLIINNKLNEIEKIINKTNDPDTLREISIWIYWLINKKTIPDAVFDLTCIKFHLSKKDREERLKRFKKIIITSMYNRLHKNKIL